MRYQIQTTPIWDAYHDNDYCPLCAIYEALDKKFTAIYLGDAVMSPDTRTQVNKYGFCKLHTQKLFQGDGKLGLALQLETRSEHLKQQIKPLKNAKAAKKQAALLHAASSCVVCERIEQIMPRYLRTVAQMYDNEPEFVPLFDKSFLCFEHYIKLLECADYAREKSDAFISSLNTVICALLEKNAADLRRFASAFDYKNRGKITADPEALVRAVELIKT